LKPNYVLLEGVDLSGKSSTIRSLKTLVPAIHVRHSSLLESNRFLDVAKTTNKDGSARVGHMYLKALDYDLENFVWPKIDTVQDSTILLRSLGYHAAANLKELLKEFEKLIYSHPHFDQIFILSASIEERRRRLLSRLKKHPNKVTRNDLLIIENPEFFVRMEKSLVFYATKYFAPLVVVDTEKQTSLEMAKQIGQACGML